MFGLWSRMEHLFVSLLSILHRVVLLCSCNYQIYWCRCAQCCGDVRLASTFTNPLMSLTPSYFFLSFTFSVFCSLSLETGASSLMLLRNTATNWGKVWLLRWWAQLFLFLSPSSSASSVCFYSAPLPYVVAYLGLRTLASASLWPYCDLLVDSPHHSLYSPNRILTTLSILGPLLSSLLSTLLPFSTFFLSTLLAKVLPC